MSDFQTCCVCHQMQPRLNVFGGVNLFQYGVRHYAHADCGLQKWGRAWLDAAVTFEFLRAFIRQRGGAA